MLLEEPKGKLGNSAYTACGQNKSTSTPNKCFGVTIYQFLDELPLISYWMLLIVKLTNPFNIPRDFLCLILWTCKQNIADFLEDSL